MMFVLFNNNPVVAGAPEFTVFFRGSCRSIFSFLCNVLWMIDLFCFLPFFWRLYCLYIFWLPYWHWSCFVPVVSVFYRAFNLSFDLMMYCTVFHHVELYPMTFVLMLYCTVFHHVELYPMTFVLMLSCTCCHCHHLALVWSEYLVL